MQITMTLADGILSLALGVIGSMTAAYFFRRSPNLWDLAATKWAQRSEQTARKRIDKLSSRVAAIELLKNDTNKFVGWMGNALNDLLFMVMFVILFMSLVIIIIATKLSRGDADNGLLFVGLLAVGLTMGLSLLATRHSIMISEHQDLDDRLEELKSQIAKIQARLGQSS